MTSTTYKARFRYGPLLGQLLSFGAARPASAIPAAPPNTPEKPGERSATLGEHMAPLPPAASVDGVPSGFLDEHEALGALVATLAPLCGAQAPAIAARLLDHFGSLPALLRASTATLDHALEGHGEVRDLIRAIGTLVRQERRLRLAAEPVLPDGEAVLDYLYSHMAHEPAEQVRVLYLDTKNRLLRDDVAARGTINRVDIFPREIVRRALELGATGLILAHNHPSGDTRPSQGDLTATRAVADAAQLFDIALHDHIIVGRNGWLSLRSDGHL